MGAGPGIYGLIILVLLVLVVFLGFTCYTFHNYCIKREKFKKRTDYIRKDNILPAAGSIVDSVDKYYKTTTDDDPSVKYPTFDQILKQEERSSFSVHQLKFPSPQHSLSPQQQSTSTSAPVTNLNEPVVNTTTTTTGNHNTSSHKLTRSPSGSLRQQANLQQQQISGTTPTSTNSAA